MEDYPDDDVVQDVASVEPTVHSPVVGEKRPRDEDEAEAEHDGPVANGSNGVVKHDSEKQEIQSVAGSNSHAAYSNTSGSVPTIVHQGGGGHQDALYIGDLQWVSNRSQHA